MIAEVTQETVTLSSLVDNDITTSRFDNRKPNDYVKDEIVKEDGTTLIYKRPYVTKVGAITQHPNQRVILNSKNVIDI